MKKYQLEAIYDLLMELRELIGREAAQAMITGDFKQMANYERLLSNTIGAAEVISTELTINKEA